MSDDTHDLSQLAPDDATRHAVACVERLLAQMKAGECLEARKAVEAVKANSPDADQRCEEAADAVPNLRRCADLSNECPPGWPDDDGPWAWLALAKITEAASMVVRDPTRALGLIDSAAHDLTYGNTALRDAERRWRRARLAALLSGTIGPDDASDPRLEVHQDDASEAEGLQEEGREAMRDSEEPA